MKIKDLKNGYAYIKDLDISIPAPDNFIINIKDSEINFKNPIQMIVSEDEYDDYMVNMGKSQVLSLAKHSKETSIIIDNNTIKSIIIVFVVGSIDADEEYEFIFDNNNDQFIDGHINEDFIFHDFLLYDILNGYESIDINDRKDHLLKKRA